MFTSNHQMGLSALDVKTGRPVWRAPAFQPADFTDIMFDGSAVYAVGFQGRLWAIDAATGALRWEHIHQPGGVNGGCLSTPIAAEGLIIYSGGSDWTTGQQLGLVWGLDWHGLVRRQLRAAGGRRQSPRVSLRAGSGDEAARLPAPRESRQAVRGEVGDPALSTRWPVHLLREREPRREGAARCGAGLTRHLCRAHPALTAPRSPDGGRWSTRESALPRRSAASAHSCHEARTCRRWSQRVARGR